MEDNLSAMCKVLVYESNPDHASVIRQFCESHNLIPIKVQADSLTTILEANVDLGAIFISDNESDGEKDLELCNHVHSARPELPIFLKTQCKINSSASEYSTDFFTAYEIDEIDNIVDAINDQIFNRHYPNALLRGINEIAIDTLHHFFTDSDIQTSSPYLVKDRIIYGELFSLISVESSWCRGYMMLQTDQRNVTELVRPGIVESESVSDFRAINDVLSETTNMMWGGIKNRFVSYDEPCSASATHVPIIVNHFNKYITFGTDIPQLCFRYNIKQRSGDQKEIIVYQKLIFNLSWEPEKFSENEPTVDDFIESGELEFF